MIRALYTAASGMMAQETNLDNVANNLANSSTAGFRRRRIQFEDLVYQTLVMPGAAASQQTTMVAGLQVGLGTRTAASEVIQLQGDFSQTGNPLDLTIQGQGFFQVLLPDGQTAYTRAGSFHLDAQGNLVTQDGNAVQPAVTIPPGATSMTVAQDGTISVTLSGQSAAQQVGSLQLALFNNPGGLNSTGRNLFLATTASGDPVIGTPGGSEGLGSVEQGMLEQSNVSVVDEGAEVRSLLESVTAAAKSRGGAPATRVPERITVRRRGVRASCAEIGWETLTSPDARASVAESEGLDLMKPDPALVSPPAIECGAADRIPKDAALEVVKRVWNPGLSSWEVYARCLHPGDCVPFLVRVPGRELPLGSRTPARPVRGVAPQRPIAPLPSDGIAATPGAIPLVRRGETVTLLWDENGIRLVVPAICLDPGAEGQKVRARVARGGRLVRAIVVSAGKLRAAS